MSQLKYIIGRTRNNQSSYLTNSELWSVDINNAVSFDEKDAKQIMSDFDELQSKHIRRNQSQDYDYFIESI